MKMPEASFFEWQRQFGSEAECLSHIKQMRWPNGFICPRCRCEHGYELTTRDVYECSQCHKQTSVTADTSGQEHEISLAKYDRFKVVGIAIGLHLFCSYSFFKGHF